MDKSGENSLEIKLKMCRICLGTVRLKENLYVLKNFQTLKILQSFMNIEEV